MTLRDDDTAAGGRLPVSSFAALACAPCPTYDAMLVAIEAQFGAVDSGAIDERLDELARSLFGIRDRPPRQQAVALTAATWKAVPRDGASAGDLLLGHALRAGRAHPLLRAVIAAETARRVGLEARLVESPPRWLVGLQAHATAIAADLGADPDATTGRTRCLCAHEVAFAILSRLAHALQSAERTADAHRAAGLRLLLPLDPELRAALGGEGPD